MKKKPSEKNTFNRRNLLQASAIAGAANLLSPGAANAARLPARAGGPEV